MLHRYSSKIIHIDFGDCFEVAMHRESFPEKIPFRLTRMMVKAMEVSGIEGNFRSTAESVMTVLRENIESVMAVLEAFVYDPLVNWRLLKPDRKTVAPTSEETEQMRKSMDKMPEALKNAMNLKLENLSLSGSLLRSPKLGSKPMWGATPRQMYVPDPGSNPESDSEVLNSKALAVLARVESKLKGRDFTREELNVKDQVEALIKEATSHVNLCQCYIGWYSLSSPPLHVLSSFQGTMDKLICTSSRLRCPFW
jgi:FKBP12-rapamycin complex-associated protein